MRSTFFGIETMKRAILAQRRALDVTGNNIANAATPGYTRQQVVLASTRPYAYPGLDSLIGPGQIGTGVVVEQIRRVRDEFVDKQIRVGNANKGEVEVEKNSLQQVENVFLEPSSTEGLNGALSKFFEAWQELSKRPDNTAARENVKNTGINLVDVIHNIDQSLRSIREDLNGQLQKDVVEINRITKQIAGLNDEIAKVFTHGDTPNDLMDKRDLLLDELSNYVDISVENTDVNGVAVYVGNRVLVRDDNSYDVTDEMAWDHPSQNTQTPYFQDVSQNDFYMLSNFSKGELKGLVNSRDVFIPEVQAKFTEMVQALANEVNNLHSGGFGIEEQAGNFTTTTSVILPAAVPLNKVGINPGEIRQISTGDLLRIEDSDGEAVTVKVTQVDLTNNEIYFEMIDTLQKPDVTTGYSSLTNYQIDVGANVRKIDPMKNNFFDLQTILEPQFAGDTNPAFLASMTSSIRLPENVNLNTTVGELETIWGVDITDNIIGKSLKLDDNATTQNITGNMTLQEVFSRITRARTLADEGKPLEVKFDKVNSRIMLQGTTRNALSQLGGTTGSDNPLLRILGFEGQGITGFNLPTGTNLTTTLSDIGISTGWFMIDGVELYVDDTNQTLGNFLNTVNNALNTAGSVTAGTNVFFDRSENSIKIVSDHQFSTKTEVVTTTSPAPFVPPVGNSNFLTVLGLQRESDITQDSALQNLPSVTTSDIGARIKVNDAILGDVAKIASAATYAGIPGDNSIALAIAQLKNTDSLNDTASGFSGNPTETIDEFYNNMIAKVGTDSQRAITDSDIADKFLEYYETRRQEVSGVSIDEELTKMIEQQRAYQAASRMINVVDEMLDRIINATGLVGR